MDALMVALGGAVGSVTRWFIGTKTNEALSAHNLHLIGSLPLGTLIANILAGFIIGFATSCAGANIIDARTKLLLTTGLCGGLSTFSTFSLETMNLIQQGSLGGAALNIGLSVISCLVAVWAGTSLAGCLR